MREPQWTQTEFTKRTEGLLKVVGEVFTGEKYSCLKGINHVSVANGDGAKVIDIYIDGSNVAVYDSRYLDKARRVSSLLSREYQRDFGVVKVGDW